MKPTLINIRERIKNPEFYDRTRDMEVALTWNSIKKTLESVGAENLFPYIKSVRLTPKNIVITTEKPLINQELKIHTTSLLLQINTNLAPYSQKREKILFI